MRAAGLWWQDYRSYGAGPGCATMSITTLISRPRANHDTARPLVHFFAGVNLNTPDQSSSLTGLEEQHARAFHVGVVRHALFWCAFILPAAAIGVAFVVHDWPTRRFLAFYTARL